jgi:hypothetical protein
MSVSNQVVKQLYSGDGSNKTFAIPFAFISRQAINQVKVYLVDTLGKTTLQTTPTNYVFSPDETDPAVLTPAANIVFVTAPTNTQKVLVCRNLSLQQVMDFINTVYYQPEDHEEGMDRLLLMIQQLNDSLSRSIKINILDETLVDTNPAMARLADLSLLQTYLDPLTGKYKFRWVSADTLTGGGQALLALPTDGKFGGPGSGLTGTAGSVSGVDASDKISDAFDKVEVVLEKIAPAKPPNLSAVALGITGSYAAKESGTGTSRATVIDSTTPTIATLLAFFDGDFGILSALVDAITGGSKTLSTADDTSTTVGTGASLQITSDVDPYAGQAGKQNFWKQLLAQINIINALALGPHTASMTHSTTGTSSLNFSVDNPVTPSINAAGRTLVGSGTGRRVSGVPSLASGDTLTVGFTVDNAVKYHYNATKIASASAPEATGTVNAPLPGSPPANGASIAASIALTVASNKYNENTAVTASGFNSKGTSGTASITGNIRIDTVSSETGRYKSGTGQYPAKGSGAAQFGDVYDSTALLSANKELQLLNGAYQYPPAVNYSTNLPTAGPDYTGLTTDSYASMRWATFKVATISAASSITFSLQGGQNLGASTLITGLALYVLVDGGGPTAGWIDANAAYSGVGNPTNNGDAALDVAQSTTTTKRVTFGATTRTGDVYVRVGIPSGSTKKISGVA